MLFRLDIYLLKTKMDESCSGVLTAIKPIHPKQNTCIFRLSLCISFL